MYNFIFKITKILFDKMGFGGFFFAPPSLFLRFKAGTTPPNPVISV